MEIEQVLAEVLEDYEYDNVVEIITRICEKLKTPVWV